MRPVVRVRLQHLLVVALGFTLSPFASACGSSTPAAPGGGSTPTPTPSTKPGPVLGSYELALTSEATGAKAGTLRLDLLNNERSELTAWTLEGATVRQHTVTVDERAVRLAFRDDTSSMSLVVARGEGGRLTTVSGERNQGAAQEKLVGVVGPDTTPPRLGTITPALPWEEVTLPFSETVLEKDIALPKVAGVTLSSIPVPKTPWVAGLRLTSSGWDAIPDPLGNIAIGDPSKNVGTLSVAGAFIKVGPALPSYVFDRDEPAWKSASARRTEAECDTGSCLLFQSGERVALRLAPGGRTVTLHLRFLSGRDGAPGKVPLTVALAPRGGATQVLEGLEGSFEAVSAPIAPEKSYATEVIDLPLELPVAPEVAVTLALPATTGAPFFVALRSAE